MCVCVCVCVCVCRSQEMHAYVSRCHMTLKRKLIIQFTLEPEILYLAYLALEVTSPAIVGLNAFLASPNLP